MYRGNERHGRKSKKLSHLMRRRVITVGIPLLYLVILLYLGRIEMIALTVTRGLLIYLLGNHFAHFRKTKMGKV